MPKKRTSVSRRPRKKPVRRGTRKRADGERALETALAGLAHDIRTPLGGILALSELLAASEIGERERAWALTIKGTAEYLTSLATLLVDAAKADVAGLELRRDLLKPHELVEGVTALLAARAQAKGLQVETAIAEEVPPVLVGDAVRLRAALENLADNAVKFTDSGRISFAVAAERAARGRRVRLVFSVTDSGIGLGSAEVQRLFRPFTQASEEVARRYGGAGLGLVSVRRLAQAMGGGLKITSARGHGSTFRLWVVLDPALEGAAQTANGVQAAEPPRRLHILCAEDNPFGRVVLNTILTELGHRADFVSSGDAAYAAVERGDFDAVLMDVTLSGVDGIEATRRIRALPPPHGHVPIIGISGRSTPADEAAARAAGMDAYLTKPISAKLLAEHLMVLTEPDRLQDADRAG
jgi:CheY-like chemotaxis protein/nitrogen-specific signal transduction histidine kinase